MTTGPTSTGRGSSRCRVRDVCGLRREKLGVSVQSLRNQAYTKTKCQQIPDDREVAQDQLFITPASPFRELIQDYSPNSTTGRIRPGCHAHVFVSMECPGLPDPGHAHEDVSMAPKSLARHHLRFISWSRGGDQRGVSTHPVYGFFLAPASWCAGSAIKRPCEPVPVTHAPEGHRPDAKR